MTNKFLTNEKSNINLSLFVKTIHPFRGRSIDVDSYEQSHTVTGNKKSHEKSWIDFITFKMTSFPQNFFNARI